MYADGRVFVVAHSFGSVPGEMEAPPAFDVVLKKYDKDHDGKISEKEFPKDDLYLFRRLEAAGIPGAEVSLKQFFGFIDQDKDGQISRDEWNRFLIMYRLMSLRQRIGLFAISPGAGGESHPNVVWREQRALAEVPSPLHYRERIYMVRDGGIVSCLDAKSGRLVYRERCGAGGAYFSSLVAGDGKVYVSSQRGVVVVLTAGDKLEVLARNDLKEPILATPALVDGKIYIRTETNLYAFGK